MPRSTPRGTARRWALACLGAIVVALAAPALAAEPTPPGAVARGAAAEPLPPVAAFTPDPRTVQRWSTGAREGWRYPQAGWTVVHIEGDAHERGLQHGHLLAAEIADHIRALSAYWSPTQPARAWARNREIARRLLSKGFPDEQWQEMQGIVDGANAQGARVGRRRLDVLDIVTLNAANELDTLDAALRVTPDAARAIGMTPREVARTLQAVRRQRARPMRCNAFIANGPATRDGRILFGHITMYDLYPANFYNVWMEVKPTTGHRFVMQTTPGGIHSAMDYAINDAGILLAETTLEQGPMVLGGTPLTARIRRAQQYADSIDAAVEMLTRDDNGLCSTEWVLGDLKRNEIALLTLVGGTGTVHRSSRNEWFEGAEGFYWSANNIKDTNARLLTQAWRDGRPSTAASFTPSKRDVVWLRKYREAKGRMDLAFAREALTTPEIVSAFGVDAKATDATLASRLHSLGAFGPPAAATWLPSTDETIAFPAIRPLVQNPWTLLDVAPPPPSAVPPAADRPDPRHLPPMRRAPPQPSPPPPDREAAPAWRGTLRPATDADLWLSTGFANFERIVALERTLGPAARWTDAQRDTLAVELAYYRSLHGHGVRVGGGDVPLADTRAGMGDGATFDRVTGKGVLFLHTLREIVGAATFDAAMRDFGRAHDGRAVTAAAFQAFLQARTAQPLAPLFEHWLRGTGLPRLALADARSRAVAGGWETEVTLDTSGIGPALSIPVTVETAAGATTRSAVFDAARDRLVIATAQRPERVVVDRHGSTARRNGSPYTILTLDSELEHALIVYGTLDDAAANREAARVLQGALRRREHNVQPPIVADHEVTDAELARHHLLLVGRPSTHAVAQRFASHWPVDFGPRSFMLRDRLYAHPETALLVAADNPLDARWSMVLVAGASGLATYQIAGRFVDDVFAYAPAVVWPYGRPGVDLVPPLPSLTRVPRFID